MTEKKILRAYAPNRNMQNTPNTQISILIVHVQVTIDGQPLNLTSTQNPP